jgi:glycosyltransferase involved in cell wall biosynthesis
MPQLVSVYNPLPDTLSHYEAALVDILTATGMRPQSAAAPSIEVHDKSVLRRATAALLDLGAHLRTARRANHVIVCWPTYGLLEPALWLAASRRCTVSLIVHDPSPLRRQVGMGRVARTVGGAASRFQHIRVVVHSQAAARQLEVFGWELLTVLPHPVSLPQARRGDASDADTVLVCGQYKPARDLDLLATLGPLLRGRGYRTVVIGRGWPSLPGWEVHDRFLSEDELDEHMMRSAAVLIPYSRFYQSGIAIRALELGVPVVGPDHPFLADVFGPGWPGLIPTTQAKDWADGVDRVTGLTARLQASSAAFRHRCEREWAEYFAGVRAADRHHT